MLPVDAGKSVELAAAACERSTPMAHGNAARARMSEAGCAGECERHESIVCGGFSLVVPSEERRRSHRGQSRNDPSGGERQDAAVKIRAVRELSS